ncbi:MAG TPA: PIG-L family deacetylase [Chloroflexia bacterium]|nr:PIG-L family deacetylase [Chloroflexia bacterium]
MVTNRESTATGAPRILGVFAHPDDEVFVAGGTLAKYAAAGSEIMVVSATKGQAGQIRDARIATRRTLGEVRAAELHVSSAKLGVQHSVCWDYGDGMLQELDPELLVGDVVRTIRSFRPDVVMAFGPDGGYGHPDHITMSLVTTDAVRRAADAAEFREQIAGGLHPHQPGRYYHSCFPQSRLLLLERLVQWLVQHKERFKGSLDFVQALMLLSEESTMLKYAGDFMSISWYPPGFYIVEQGEAATNLYLILAGRAQAVVEHADGTLEAQVVLEPGMFFGEKGLAYGKPRNAHVIAAESTTCLIFSPGKPSNFAGRGEDAHLVDGAPIDGPLTIDAGPATTCIDVSDFVRQKVEAMAAHRSQFALDPDMLPLSIMQELFGREYFIRVYPARDLAAEL